MNEETRTFIEAFDSHFREIRDNPLVLYGIGEKTRWILENLPVYNIIGLMDQDTTGGVVYGKKVLNFNEAAKQAKTIIIVANMASNRIIFNRIRSLQDIHHIPIFFTDGTNPQHNQVLTAAISVTLESKKAIEKHISRAEVISFDLFDTLIMRETYLPTDIFDLVEQRAKNFFKRDLSFKVPRVEAEKFCFNHDKFYTINMIYDRLRETLDCSTTEIRHLMNEELDMELRYSRPRSDVVDLYNFSLSQGKKVCITTDTYLDRGTIAEFLENAHIPPPDEFFISNLERKSKHAGTIWDQIRSHYQTDSILHLGDNRIDDVEQPLSKGLSAVQIATASDLLGSVMGTIPLRARTFTDRRILGLLASRFLNSPFSLMHSPGKLRVSSMADLGYLCFGPLVYAYICWLICEVRHHPDARVLFFARDGYLLKELYEKTAQDLKIQVPEGTYLLTSRRSASVISLEKDSDIAFVTETMCRYRKNSLREILFLAFGIRGHDDDTILDKRCLEMTNGEIIRYLTENYGAGILANAKDERDAYYAYLNSLGLDRAAQLYCVNFVGRGATQQFISEILKMPMTGYYFALEKASKESFFDSVSAKGLYDSFPGDAGSSQLLRNYVFGEIILSSPDEQFIRFASDGTAIYDSRATARDFSRIQECHDGIREFFKDVLMIQYTNNELPTLDIVDELYGLFLSGRCTVSEPVRDSLVFKDYYDASSPNGSVLEI